jgi:threonylcarbamoyladenosine tRNA methylthiotransferase CDKAL1
MLGLLSKAGYTLTNDPNEAALWLLNSCTVKTPSETQMDNSIANAQRLNKRVIVAGCVSQVCAWRLIRILLEILGGSKQ